MIPAFLAVLLACSGATKHPTVDIAVKGHSLTVELADDQVSHQEGLMNRDSLGANRGMLFIYEDKAPRSFWMKNTRIPLSIAFLEDDGTILKIADMRPFDVSSTKSLYPVRYALEVNQGWFEERGIRKGDRVEGLPAGQSAAANP